MFISFTSSHFHNSPQPLTHHTTTMSDQPVAVPPRPRMMSGGAASSKPPPPPTSSSDQPPPRRPSTSTVPSSSLAGSSAGGAGGRSVAKQQFIASFTDGNAHGTITIRVIEASGVTAADPGGTSDPYARVGFFKEQLWTDRDKKTADLKKKECKKTKTIKKTLDPVWNEDLAFEIEPNVLREYSGIKVQVWDWDRVTGDDFLGMVSLTWEELATRVDHLEIESSRPGFDAAPRCTLSLTPRPKPKKDDLNVQGTITLQFAFNKKK